MLLTGFVLPLFGAKKQKRERFDTGHFIRLSAGTGITDLNYDLEGGRTLLQPTWELQTEYVYFFNTWVGLGSGLHFTRYATRANLTDEMVWSGLTDYIGDEYDHHLRFNDWQERQRMFQMEIPILVHFKYKPKKAGFFSSIGLELGIPLNAVYTHDQGEQIHSGYYPFWDVWMEGLPGRFETESAAEPIEDNIRTMTKVNCVGYMEAGALFEVSKRTDITLSVYAQYTFNNSSAVKPNDRTALGFATQENGYEHFMNAYNGLIGTDHVGTIHPWAFGLKVGVSVTPRLTEREKMRMGRKIARKWKDYLPPLDTLVVTVTDTLVLYDTIYTGNLHLTTDYPPYGRDTLTIVRTRAQQQLDTLLQRGTILFNDDTDTPAMEYENILDSLATMLQRYPDLKVTITGYATTEEGDDLTPALKRAQAVANVLRTQHVREEQILIEPSKAHAPFHNHQEDTDSRKRRVEIKPAIEFFWKKQDT